MAGHHPPYPPEFRQQIIELMRIGRTPAELAWEFEPTITTIRKWVKQADRDDWVRDDGSTSEPPETNCSCVYESGDLQARPW